MTAVYVFTDKPGFPHQKCYHPEPPWAHCNHLPSSSEESLQFDGEQLLSQIYPLRPLQRTVQGCQGREKAHEVLVQVDTEPWSYLFTCVNIDCWWSSLHAPPQANRPKCKSQTSLANVETCKTEACPVLSCWEIWTMTWRRLCYAPGAGITLNISNMGLRLCFLHWHVTFMILSSLREVGVFSAYAVQEHLL